MGYATLFRKATLSITCFSMLVQTPVIMAANAAQAAPAQAAASAPAAMATKAADGKNVPLVSDIRLHQNNTLIGQVVSVEGAPQVKQPVSLMQKDKVMVRTVTDKNGYFAFSKVPAGTYNVVSPKAQGLCRVWAPKTAPPIAQPGVLLVDGHGVVRAQQGPISYWLGKPWVIAGLVAAAVAIPVAIHNHQNDKEEVSPN